MSDIMPQYTYDILAAGIEQGTITSSGDQSASDCVRSVGYTEVHEGISSVVLTVTSSTSKTIQVDFLGYRSTNSGDIVCDLYWYDSPKTFDLTGYNGIKYFRVVMRYYDRSNITPSAITSANLVETYVSPWRIENSIFTHEDLPDMIPRLVPPYPSGAWYVENGHLIHSYLPNMIPRLAPPYPSGVWYVEDDHLTHSGCHLK